MGNSFSGLGYKSANLLKNLGLLAIAIAAIALLVIALLLIKKLVKKNERAERIYNFISSRIFFNMIIRAFLESYLKLAISSFIAIQALSFEDRDQKINSVMSIIMTAIVISAPLAAGLFLILN